MTPQLPALAPPPGEAGLQNPQGPVQPIGHAQLPAVGMFEAVPNSPVRICQHIQLQGQAMLFEQGPKLLPPPPQ